MSTTAPAREAACKGRGLSHTLAIKTLLPDNTPKWDVSPVISVSFAKYGSTKFSKFICASEESPKFARAIPIEYFPSSFFTKRSDAKVSIIRITLVRGRESARDISKHVSARALCPRNSSILQAFLRFGIMYSAIFSVFRILFLKYFARLKVDS